MNEIIHDLEKYKKTTSDGVLRITKGVLIVFTTYGVNIDYIQQIKDGLVLIIIGEQIQDVGNQKWCKVHIDTDGDIGFSLNDGTVWFVMDGFISMDESAQRIHEWLLN